MQTEIEAKWLDINLAEMRTHLMKVGAHLITPERLMLREVFDYPDDRLGKAGGWVRIRDEGDKITLSYKQLNNRTLRGTKEVTVVVNDFAATRDFLTALGLRSYAIQETKRESWTLDGVEVTLDTWPWIPSFIELESPTEALLRKAAEKLGLDFSQALHGSVETAYQALYDVTEEEVGRWKEIRFSKVPTWLQKKVKQ